MYTANNVADWFISKVDVDSGDTLSHLKLQKLVYYAQAWYFSVYDTVLFEEQVLARKDGPIVYSVFQRFNTKFPFSSISRLDVELELVDFHEAARDILNDVNILYGEHTGAYLKALTQEEVPWRNARFGRFPDDEGGAAISLQDMKAFYFVKLADARASGI